MMKVPQAHTKLPGIGSKSYSSKNDSYEFMDKSQDITADEDDSTLGHEEMP